VNGVQCDTCRKFAPLSPPEGWLMLLQQESPARSLMSAVLGGGSGGAELTGTFCGLRCLAEYAYVRLAAEGAQGGKPGAEGWLG
jgi:hypothetical protein